MTAPRRRPYFFDSAGSGEELTYPDTADEMRWLLSRLAATVEAFPHWHTDNEGHVPQKVTLAVDLYEPELLQIRFVTPLLSGVIAARPHVESGYVQLVVESGGRALFEAYIDHPWEEYELYPPGDGTPEHEEGPGRMGKRMTWLSLSTAAWPQLDPLSDSGRFNLIIDER